MKVIGNTVGTPLPKPDLMQTDPTKGDYVKGKEEFLKQVSSNNVPLVVNLSGDGTTDKNVIDMYVAWMENRQVLASMGDAAIALTGLRGESAFFSGVVNAKEVAVVVTGNTYEITETDLATEQYVKDYAQPKGDYLTAVPDGYAKTEDIPTKPEDIGAQPVGDYLTEVPSGYATEEYVRNKIAEAELGGEEVDLSGYAQKSELPTKVSQLENDKGYLTEHQDISGKLDASALPTAINTALAQAKASGEFDGQDGQDGQDGYTPQKDVDYFDGQPGKDGVDGVDGAPGTPGADGITPHIGSNGNWYIGDTDTGKPSRGASGQPGQNGSPGADGSPGKDGVSATHSWNGTVLTVTSASGTSSADLKGAKGDKGDSIKGDTGSPGADGVSPTVAVSKSGKVTTVSITDKNGTKTATINDGSDGSNGKDGTSVTVKSVSESTADGGSNVVTFSDGKTITIKNGSKGSTGATGATGAAGKTPVRGVDYWTAADQESIVQQVIVALGTPVFGRVDADNNIILTGVLGEGTYTFAYDDADGVRTTIGTLGHNGTETPVYTNLLPAAIDTNGSIYNGIGWKTNIRLGSSGTVTEASATGMETTGFVPVSGTDTIYFANIAFPYDGSQTAYQYFALFDASKTKLTCNKINVDLSAHGVTYDANKNMKSLNVAAYMTHYSVSGTPAFFRFSAEEISSESIITVNQPIS
jgi:hypothetical protein